MVLLEVSLPPGWRQGSRGRGATSPCGLHGPRPEAEACSWGIVPGCVASQSLQKVP